jgi:hypothetical protein
MNRTARVRTAPRSIYGSKPPRPSLPTVRATARRALLLSSIDPRPRVEPERRKKEHSQQKPELYCRGSDRRDHSQRGGKKSIFGRSGVLRLERSGQTLVAVGIGRRIRVAARGVRATNEVRRGGEWGGLVGTAWRRRRRLCESRAIAGRVTGINGRMERGPLIT